MEVIFRKIRSAFILFKFYWHIFWVWIVKRKPKIYSKKKMLSLLINNHMSMTRFGDGEFIWMMGQQAGSFQDCNDRLAERLINTLKIRDEKLLICVPSFFRKLKPFTYKRRINEFNFRYIHDRYSNISKLLDFHYVYGDTLITRFYSHFKHVNERKGFEYIKQIKKIWKDKRILIVEGSNVKFGVGNDLLNNAKSVNRIICPKANSFSYYDEILKSTMQIIKSYDLVLTIIGPTATILVGDLVKISNIQVVDIGQLDIEYMWFINKSKVCNPVQFKNCIETDVVQADIIQLNFDKDKYNQEIIKVIGE